MNGNQNNRFNHLTQQLVHEELKEIVRQVSLDGTGIDYRSAWCVGRSAVRFTSDELRALFPPPGGAKGIQESGENAFFEISIASGDLCACICIAEKLEPDELHFAQCLDAGDADPERRLRLARFAQLTPPGAFPGNYPEALRGWIDEALPELRSELRRLKVKDYPESSGEETYAEGGLILRESSAYERDPKARARCIELYGTVCAVCGFDSGAVYGGEFAGIIDIHHKHPLYQIHEEHETDPAEDLVPVCPNCHRMLHSRPGGGVYSVEELKEKLLQQRRKGTNS